MSATTYWECGICGVATPRLDDGAVPQRHAPDCPNLRPGDKVVPVPLPEEAE